MLKYIEYSITFGTTGRTLAEKINFKKGFGTITGPNEAGKSVVIEMVRWALFGASALRGKVSEYKKAKVKLDFLLKGVEYRVERSPTNAKIFRGDIEIAVGTTPVNDKVVQLFGFGLAVFDVSCVANQGEIEAIGTMKPTERKRLVDSVIGLGVVDDLAKSAGEEANSLKRVAKDISDRTPEPITPARPEGYRPLVELVADLSAMSEAQKKIAEINGRLHHVLCEPVAPVETVKVPSTFLRELTDLQEENETKLRKAKMDLSVTPVPSIFTYAELDKMEVEAGLWKSWKLAEQIKAAHSEPTVSIQELDDDIIQMDENDRADRLSHLRQQLANKSHTCPACAHTWAPDAEDLVAQIEKLDGAVHRNVLLTRLQIKNMLQRWSEWAVAQKQLTALGRLVEVEEPKLTVDMIEIHRKRNGFAVERAALEQIIMETETSMVGKPDFRAQLKEREKYENAMQGFTDAMLAYTMWMDERSQLLIQRQLLEGTANGYEELKTLTDEVRLYDSLMSRYEADLKTYTDQMMTVQGMQEEAAEWDKAKVALTALRSNVKQHLMPSLNRVASYYLQQMTGGQRQVVFADEDFNISIDGQDINTLSGSGKAVAGLALRLGLGQVLTNNVFSLFVGDEIDASMDKDRADNTANTLQTLKSKVSQILLITHKFPTADYYITVGKTHEPEQDED